MEKIAIAKVAVDKTTYNFDKVYSYKIPKDFLDLNLVGCRVLVPFGRGNKTYQGIVLSIDETDHLENIKSLTAVLDKVPLLNEEIISLAIWMKNRYYCTFFDAFKLMIPAGIQMNLKFIYKLNPNMDKSILQTLSKEEQEVIDILNCFKGKAYKEKILKELEEDVSHNVFDSLEQKGILLKEQKALRKINDASIKMVKVAEKYRNYEEMFDIKLSAKQQEVYDLVLSMEQVSAKEVCYFLGVTASVVDALVKKGICEYFEEEIFRDPYKESNFDKEIKEINLNDEQQTACNDLERLYREEKPYVSLLYGVTGCGKTSVFMKLIDRVYNEGKGIIVMVPEIALTAQIIDLFKNKYKGDVAVFHSNLSLSERMDEWKRIKKGQAKIAIGTRSAIFAPFDKLGLIIMDEEQEYSYKSDQSPRFHARDVAKFRCSYNKALLVLSSATPSVETYYFAKSGKYHINTIKNRYKGINLPKVTVVDMNKELLNGNDTPFSTEFVNGVRNTVASGNQAIILLNRRGYNTFASCKSCGETITCPSCSISMTYHSDNNRLMCHYCGYSVKFSNKCPNCHEDSVNFSGFGTQRVEEGLKNILSGLRILRMDADTTMAKFSHEKKLKDFADGNYDVMVGTQMVAKGLDFPKVTFVGILSADQALYSDDFRSYERAFSLFTQVIGRSGRSNSKGVALIQTYTPENNIINLAASQDYDEFYNSEIVMRKAMLYPPFVDLGVICFVGEKEAAVAKASIAFLKMFKEEINLNHKNLPIHILGPSPASIAKIKNKYRYKIIIKFKNNKEFRDMMSKLLLNFGKLKEYKSVNLFIDINPDIVM